MMHTYNQHVYTKLAPLTVFTCTWKKNIVRRTWWFLCVNTLDIAVSVFYPAYHPLLAGFLFQLKLLHLTPINPAMSIYGHFITWKSLRERRQDWWYWSQIKRDKPWRRGRHRHNPLWPGSHTGRSADWPRSCGGGTSPPEDCKSGRRTQGGCSCFQHYPVVPGFHSLWKPLQPYWKWIWGKKTST